MYYTCPKCQNKALCSTEEGVDFHTLCICEKCAAELYAEPQFDGSVKFVELSADEIEEERYNRLSGKSYRNKPKAI